MQKVGFMAAAAALILTGASANAADIARPVYKAPVVVPAFNWSGFYIGGHAGWGWQHDEATIASITPALPFGVVGTPFNLERSGFLGGATVGVNWQPVGQPWVFGIEGEWTWASVDESATVIFPGNISITGNGWDPLESTCRHASLSIL